jgi:hypothetical protein
LAICAKATGIRTANSAGRIDRLMKVSLQWI